MKLNEVVITTVTKESTEILRQTSNPDKVSVRLEQKTFEVAKGTFGRIATRSAFITLDRSDAEQLNLTKGMPLKDVVGHNCKIVVKEQTTPFYEGQDAKINLETGVELSTLDGEPIYRHTFVSYDMEEKDIHVAHVPTEVEAQQFAQQGNRAGQSIG